jgi:hypothetical protein
MCWVNTSASSDQQSRCYDAWFEYNQIVYEQYPTWPDSVRTQMGEQARYWSTLSYSEFALQWNGIQQAGISSGTGLVAAGLFIRQNGAQIAGRRLAQAGVSSVADGPAPAGEVIGIGLICWGGYEILSGAFAAAGTIALPQRQVWDFSFPTDNADDQAIPIPYPYDFDRCMPGWKSCESLEEDGGRYFDFDDALGAIQEEYNDNNIAERIEEREVVTTGHCPGIGSHSQFYNVNDDYTGSVTCCPCCNDRGQPDVRCFIRWPH